MVRRPQVRTLAVAGVLVATTGITTLELVNFYRPHVIASMSTGHLPWPIFTLAAGTTYHASVDATDCAGYNVDLSPTDAGPSQLLTGGGVVDFTVPRSGSYYVETAVSTGVDDTACSMQVTITG